MWFDSPYGAPEFACTVYLFACDDSENNRYILVGLCSRNSLDCVRRKMNFAIYFIGFRY
jgi:hypothetical protein